MRSSRFVPVAITLTILLALSAGLSTAQGPAPQGGGQPQAMLGSAFTYQGELKKDSVPVDDTCSMAFSLYDDASAGNMVAGPITQSVTVAGGLFTVALDFGSSPFTGDARWLGVAVQCPGDAGFNALSPRQALTAAPYALSLQPGAEIVGEVTGDAALYVHNTAAGAPAVHAIGPNPVLGETYTPNYGAVVGFSHVITGTGMGVYGSSASTDGRGVVGYTDAVSGTTYGVYGSSVSTGGYGVFGDALVYGVFGQAHASNGVGVYGYADATSGETRGVCGKSASTEGRGVYAWATATSGATFGVLSKSDSTSGTGVFGWATATSGENIGVYGSSRSPAGFGVYGLNSSTSSGVAIYGVGPNAVLGDSSTPNYAAVMGRNSATTGTGSGVYGRTDSTDGRGVYGYASATDGDPRGVYGRSDAFFGFGVYGFAPGDSADGVYGEGGQTGVYGIGGSDGVRGESPWIGVFGTSTGDNGSGVYGYASATSSTTSGVYGRSDSVTGNGVYGYAIASQGLNYGVLGETNSSYQDAAGVRGYAAATSGTAVGVYGLAHSPDSVGVKGEALAAGGANAGVIGVTYSTVGWGVFSYGELGATGAKTAVVQTPDYGWRRLYAMESPEVLFEDVGTAQLVDGWAVVAIDPLFAQTVNLERPYQVFLTPQGGYCALYVAEKTTTSFTVRAQEGSSCQIAFDYRIIAKRLGYEDVRLEPAQLPARARTEPGGLAVPQEQQP